LRILKLAAVAILHLFPGSNASFPASPYIPTLRCRNFRLSIPQFLNTAAESFKASNHCP